MDQARAAAGRLVHCRERLVGGGVPGAVGVGDEQRAPAHGVRVVQVGPGRAPARQVVIRGQPAQPGMASGWAVRQRKGVMEWMGRSATAR